MLPESRQTEHRLHPATLLFTIGGSIKRLLLPGIAVLWLAQGHRAGVWLMVLFVPTVLYQLFRYFTLTYRFAATEMIVRQGLWFRNERNIPYDRIHNVDLVQGPLHRLLGVADVRLQTASGGQAEAEFQVLSLAAVEEMRQRIFAGRSEPVAETEPAAEAPSPPEPASHLIASLSTLDLVVLGLISLRGIALVFVALGFAWEFNLFERLPIDPDILYESIGEERPPMLVVLVSVLMLLAIFIVLSIAWTILRFHGYRLERRGEDLRISCGLLTKIAATVPRQRIQLLSVHESIGHRLFGRVAIRIETAGGEGQKDAISRKWFLPLLPENELARVLDQLRPGLNLGTASWQPLAPRALRRKITRAVIFAILAAAAATLFLGPWSAVLGSLLIIWAILCSILSVKVTRYAVIPEGMVFRSGVLVRKTSVTFYDKIQVVSMAQSPFDRRHRMATFELDTPGAGPANHRIRIKYLEDRVAQGLLDTVSVRTEAAAFHW